MKKLNLISSMILMIFAMSLSASAIESPTNVIKNSNKKILEIVKSTPNTQQATFKIVKLLEEISNFNTLANNVTSGFCKNLNTDQCSKFNTTFIDLLKYSTAKKLSKYKSEKIDYLKEEISGNKATVKTLVYNGDKKFKIDYQLEKSNNKWQIVNYIVEDINTVDNYKKQFGRLFKKNSVEQIIANLKTKIEAYKSGKGE